MLLHSPDSIAPVGVLHPTAFHLERKEDNFMQNGNVGTNDFSQGKHSSVIEVRGECPQNSGPILQSSGLSNLDEVPEYRLQISKTRRSNAFSICCWLQDLCQPSGGRSQIKRSYAVFTPNVNLSYKISFSFCILQD